MSRPGYGLSSFEPRPVRSNTRYIAVSGELPLLQVFEGIEQKIKVNRIRAVEIIFICMRRTMLLGSQSLVEGVLPANMLKSDTIS